MFTKFVRTSQNTRIPHSIKTSVLRRYLSIQTQTTPNENALKFEISGHPSLLTPENNKTSYQLTVQNQAQSPLARSLFEYSNAISSIFIGPDFITVTKDEFAHWNQVRPIVEGVLEQYLKSGESVIDDSVEFDSEEEQERMKEREKMTMEEREIADEIEELIATKIRPAIQDDGGDIVFLRYSQGTVYVQLQGACTSCSLSDDTLKSGILSMLSHYIEEVEDVVNLAEVEFWKFEEKMKMKKTGRT